ALLERHLADQVADLRGFELGQEADYRESFVKNAALFEAQRQKLEKLIADNPEQQARLHRIEETARQWHQVYTDSLLAMADQPQRRAEMLAFIHTPPGRSHRFALRSGMEQVAIVERALPDDRTQKLGTTLDRLRWMSIMMLAFGVIASVLAML